jgi:catechol 2,3-dioxygenase-like lactoylglutathione lyase family enzyme
MIKGIRHTGLVVTDLTRAMEFWCGMLGFKLVRQMEESGTQIDAVLNLDAVRLTTAKLASPDGQQLELLQFHSHPDRPTWEGKPCSTGFTHIAMTVHSMKETVARLSGQGVCFPNPPQRSPDGKVIVTYAIGPENILLELVEELQ